MVEEDSHSPSQNIDVSNVMNDNLAPSGQVQYPILIGDATMEDYEMAMFLWKLKKDNQCAVRGEPLGNDATDDLNNLSNLSLDNGDDAFPEPDDPDMDISVEHTDMAQNLMSQRSQATQLSQVAAYQDSEEVIGRDAYEALVGDFKELCQMADGNPQLIKKARNIIRETNLELMREKAVPPKEGQDSTLFFPDDHGHHHGSKKR